MTGPSAGVRQHHAEHPGQAEEGRGGCSAGCCANKGLGHLATAGAGPASSGGGRGEAAELLGSERGHQEGADVRLGHNRGNPVGQPLGCNPWAGGRVWRDAWTWQGHSRPDATPTPGRTGTEATPGQNRWDDATPMPGRADASATPGWAPRKTPAVAAMPGSRRGKSRWDMTPAGPGMMGGVTPGTGATPMMGMTPLATSMGGMDMLPPQAASPSRPSPQSSIRPYQMQRQAYKLEREIEERNRPLSDEELDAMLPSEGHKVLDPPAGYAPIRTPARKLMGTPTPYGGTPMYQIPEEERTQQFHVPKELEGLPEMKPEGQQYFGKLLKEVDEEQLSVEEMKERKIMKLLLKAKNGTPPQRKSALRQLTDKARHFGAGPLFKQILPLLMSPTLEDQKRHLLVKVIARVLFKLDELVWPFVHKILVVIQPLLIDEDYYMRQDGKEIIQNLAKAAGLATMIAAMRPDIDNITEYVRNTTVRAFSVMAQALGIPLLLSFLKAVCLSKKSWQARGTQAPRFSSRMILLRQ
ncbi:g7935 [Coccomyxa viridis]|uniref:G7935 protein n=1 Tax=Coccomyxa viridis TaxID=1274662 RepID=A0ABP1FZ63_9CHLO